MGAKKNHCLKWYFKLFLPLLFLLFSCSLVHAQWTSVTPPTVSGDWWLDGIHFTSPNEGWAVGGSSSGENNRIGVLFHYQNGTWTSVTPPAVSETWLLNGVYFTSPDEGWAVGWTDDYTNTTSTGVLLHYQNGSWTSVTPPAVSNNWLLLLGYISPRRPRVGR